MQILIGGAGSTGSSLLRRILNRHPDIFSGPELNFFNKEDFFTNWNRTKKKIFWPSRFLSTRGWVPYTGTRLLKKEYGWSKQELRVIIQKTTRLESFVSLYFSKPLKEHNARHWIEKTPSNSYVFDLFLDTFNDARVIHMTRSPYDATASLVNRGFSPFFAAGMYIYNMSAGLKAENHPNYYRLNYEDLVKNPETTLKNLMVFLGLSFSDKILNPNRTESKSAINTWTNQPNQPISQSGLDRFKQTPKTIREEIETALSVFSINPKHKNIKKLPYKNGSEVSEALGYTFTPLIHDRFKRKIYFDMLKDYMHRCYKLYPTGWFHYPARIDWKQTQ